MMSGHCLSLIICLLIAQAVSGQDTADIFYFNYDLQPYTMNADGTNKTHLTDFPISSNPDWSPDGRGVVIIDRLAQIQSVDTTTSDMTQLTHTEELTRNINPKWSPDGEKIAFASDSEGNYQIYIMDEDGSNQTRLTFNEFSDGYDGLTWIYDSNHIAFIRQMPVHFDEITQSYEEFHIYVVEIDSQSEIKLTQTVDLCPAGEYYYNPTWSDSTNQLAFGLGCGAEITDVFLVNTSKDEELMTFDYQNLTQYRTQDDFDHVATYLGIAWSPNGNQILTSVFVDDDTQSMELIVIDINTTVETNELTYQQVTDTPEGGRYRGYTWTIPITSLGSN